MFEILADLIYGLHEVTNRQLAYRGVQSERVRSLVSRSDRYAERECAVPWDPKR